jgi:hypothetical protein
MRGPRGVLRSPAACMYHDTAASVSQTQERAHSWPVPPCTSCVCRVCAALIPGMLRTIVVYRNNCGMRDLHCCDVAVASRDEQQRCL